MLDTIMEAIVVQHGVACCRELGDMCVVALCSGFFLVLEAGTFPIMKFEVSKT